LRQKTERKALEKSERGLEREKRGRKHEKGRACLIIPMSLTPMPMGLIRPRSPVHAQAGRVPAAKKATAIALTTLAVAVAVASGARVSIRPSPKKLQKEKICPSHRRSAPACPPGSR